MAQFNRLKAATVLVVDDEVLVQLELSDWLKELGLTVFTADNADEAVEVLELHPEIDLLLTDIRMPGSMDGIRLAHYVAGRWPPVKIIVLSGNLETVLSELPPDTLFVPKPYQHDTLLHALSRQSPTTTDRPLGRASTH
jgi:CheY-like chemotaxis protein